MKRADLTGQKTRNTGSGIGQTEVRPVAVKIPGEQHTKPVRVFRSDDDLIHMSRSSGLKVR